MSENTPELSNVAPSEVQPGMSERQAEKIRRELDDLRQKVREWGCDECGERASTVWNPAEDKERCNKCSGMA